jgi:gamma-glutamyltranspeptidase/glutathione hydrolase
MRKNNFNGIFASLFFLTLIGATFSPSAAAQVKYPMDPVLVEPGPKELVSNEVSMVTAAHPFATYAGLEMLRRGGNAMDAAISATMVTAVLDAGLTSLAGGGQLTYYDAKSKKTTVLNFEPNAFKEDVKPYVRERDDLTGRSIRVPGSIAGLHLAIQKYGRRPWKEVVDPSIFYAENGFPLFGTAYSIMQDRYIQLTLQPSGRRMFAPNGFLPPVGGIFKQPEMAATLKKIAEQGPDYFYKGPFAEQMVKAIRDIGGKATLEDFTSYRPLELEPIRGTYKGYQITGPPPPATGIVAIIEGLNILENVDLKSMGHYEQSADSLQWVIETLRVMFTDARKYNAIAELDRALAQVLTSKEYARSQYRVIRHKIEEMKRQATEKTTELADLVVAGDGAKHDLQLGTNHVSVVDKDGNVCSFTHTIYGGVYSYAGLFVGGIVLNSAGASPLSPGNALSPRWRR